MKTKVILLIAISAIATLSFSFVSSQETPNPSAPAKVSDAAPAGGLVMDGGL